MDTVSYRDLAVEEFDTSKLLAHAANGDAVCDSTATSWRVPSRSPPRSSRSETRSK